MKSKLLLASASPRRRALLAQMGIPFDSCAPDVDETLDATRPLDQALEDLAERKAMAARHAHSHEWILSADTVVVVDGEVLGKPLDVTDAKAMLRRIAGRAHEVYTAVCLLSPSRQALRCVERARVYMMTLSDAEINAYVQTGEPMDKAGAYGAQGHGGMFIERIEGDFYAVMGLPMCRVYQMLKQSGWGSWEGDRN